MFLIDAPYINQSEKYPVGCESVSAVMLLNYLGYDIAPDEFIGKYLPLQDFEEARGEIFGPDPNEFFCGSPYSPDSFGCYAPVICRALDAATKDKYKAVNETGTPTSELLRKYIDKGMPVIYWACIDMRKPVLGPCWKLKGSGEIFTWISNEHCMLLVGYDDDGYYFNDPYENKGVVRYAKTLAEDRHAAQHSQAVALRDRVGEN